MKWMLPLAVSPRPARYGVAIGFIAIAAVLSEFVLPFRNQFPFLLYYPAVFCAAWYGGFGPGLLATVLSALCAVYFQFEPRFSFAIVRPNDHFATSIFLVVGGAISWLGEMVLRANRRLEKYALGIANQRDILEKRAAELDRLNESLRQSEGRYRSLVIATAQIVWTANPEGEVVGDMSMARTFTGKSEEELRGWGWVDSLHPEDRERTRAVRSEAFRARSVYETEYRIRKSDGEYRHFAVRGVPVLAADGSVREWVGTCTDITERKRAEEALRRASAYNRRLLEASLDPLVTIGPDGTITDVNEATEAVTGYPRAELIGKDFADYFTNPQAAREGYERAFREGFVRDYALEIRHRDGRVTPVVYNASVYRDEAGQVVGVFAAARDVTERKQAAALLKRHVEELARSNAELEQFAYVASHDLQEPLRMVASFLGLLAERYQGRLDERADKYINYAVDGAARMKALIDGLLRYSRVTTRARPLEEMGARAALDEAVANLGRAIEEKGAVVTRDDLPTVLADPTQLVQLFQNLIGNALKFCDGTPRVHVAAERTGEEWVFSVRDNGIGIAPEHRERIFQIFQRLHGRDKYPGQGMGLAICKKVVERHGGRIWVESRPGQGSTFFFTLPVVNRKLS